MRRRPLRRLVQELLDFGELPRFEVAVFLHYGEYVPPGGEVMQPHVEVGEDLLRLGIDVVVEIDEHVVDYGARIAQRLAEINLGAAVGGEVLDQQRARAFADVALDLRVAAEALGFLPHVLHWQRKALGDPGGIRDAGRLAAGDDVELLEAHVVRQGGGGEVNQLAANAWIEDELAAVDVDRARPAGGKNERLVFEKQYRLDLEQHPGRDLGDERLVGEVHARSGF